MAIKSKVVLGERVDNKDRKFGSVLEYYPVIIEDSDGVLFPALFTQNQIDEAIARAKVNPEDIEGLTKGFWDTIFG